MRETFKRTSLFYEALICLCCKIKYTKGWKEGEITRESKCFPQLKRKHLLSRVISPSFQPFVYLMQEAYSLSPEKIGHCITRWIPWRGWTFTLSIYRIGLGCFQRFGASQYGLSITPDVHVCAQFSYRQMIFICFSFAIPGLKNLNIIYN